MTSLGFNFRNVTLLKFTVCSVIGTATSSTLRLYVVKDGAKEGDLFPVADQSGSEGTITWATAPAIGSTRIAQGGPAQLGTWVELSLGNTVTGNGSYSFALVGSSSPAAWFSSSEGANSPELVLTQG